MKKISTFGFLLIFLILFSSNSFAYTARTIDLKLGMLNPEGDPETGIIAGIRLGSQIDSRINVGFSADCYHKGYEYSTKNEDIITIQSRFSSNLVPVMLDIEAKFPLETYSQVVLVPFIHIGLGYEILWNKEEYPDQKNDTKTYTGFGWMAGGGVLYKMGSNSDMILELFYNGSTVKRDLGKNEQGWLIQEMDVSGLGARIGIRLKSF